MPDYVRPRVTVDPLELFQRYVDEMQALQPGWTANDAEPDTIIPRALSFLAAWLGEELSETLTSVFRWFLANMAGIDPIDATASSGLATVVLNDTAGHTIPAGDLVVALMAGDELVGFQNDDDIVVAPGSSTAAGVSFTARDVGSQTNDLTGLARQVEAFSFVDTVTFTSTTADGTDGEEDDDYLDRGRGKLQLSTDTPILPRDYAILAKDVAGVERAVAIDGYDPAQNSGTYDPDDMNTWVPGAIAVASIDSAGADVSAGIKTDVEDYLESKREVGSIITAIDPTRTTIGCLFTFTTWSGWDPLAVKADAEAAVADYLDSLNWGRPPSGDPDEWLQDDTVRASEVYGVLNAVPGLNNVTSLTLSGGTASGSDRILAGVASLPTAGTITGTPA